MKLFIGFAFGVLFLLAACSSLSEATPTTNIPAPPEFTSPPVPTVETMTPNDTQTPGFDPKDRPPPRAKSEFKTDFSKHSVSYSEILSGGPPKDGIPALFAPRFVSVSEADGWLDPVEPVILVQFREKAKAYPIQILIWHEIVNDTVGGEPMIISFCPLCTTAIAFKSTVGSAC